ncbi:efflux RND transporter periplasmic adaptor subunit [Rhizosaccharibacter radicis]|uniref:HlyD family secretion protein n=1 Tax=Rhizosaccharibacter radicis TaxID=2782605 RepID=A0ABT1W0Q0_9PROT|nr:HlyD family secretion protein [Acetobacteraceae bacterium KSS12]
MLAITAALLALAWDHYVDAPWTRDGRVRVLVANVAPQVSGQIVVLRVQDNQRVRKGDVLYVIDPFDFQVKLRSAQAQVKMRAADQQVKQVQAERRRALTDLSTTAEEKQQYAGSAIMAQAELNDAEAQLTQAEIDLRRTAVASPVDGYVTNLQLRVGDYANTGVSNLSVVDAYSFWIDGYFEETKLDRICVGDPVEAQLMGFRQPIIGHIESLGRGVSVSNAGSSTQGLPSVDAVYTWVRLAQRIPVRVAIDHVPPGIPLASGLTVTVRVRQPSDASASTFPAEFGDAVNRILAIYRLRARMQRTCRAPDDPLSGRTTAIPADRQPEPQPASSMDLSLAPSMTAPPAP